MRSTIIIPARYSSKRFPGKPLVRIAHKTMLQRVVAIAQAAAANFSGTEIVVATDHALIAEHASTLGVKVILTDPDCCTGTDRCLQAARQLSDRPDVVINLQADAPFTPPDFVKALLNSAIEHPNFDVITPAVKLTWPELDQLRHHKITTPFSGATVVIDKNQNALWFSKNIIPAIRNEKKLREESLFSPVFQHIGLYLYRYEVLEQYVGLLQTPYETLEALEQLRLLENKYTLRVVTVKYQGEKPPSGIDSPEDWLRAENFMKEREKKI